MNKISKRQLERYPIYLKYLLSLRSDKEENISSPMIARALGFSEEMVRKDLQVVTIKEGKPKQGRNIDELISDIQTFLGYKNMSEAIIVGVGHLGQAFMNYSGFKEFGLKIVAGFDVDKKLIGTKINNKPIYDLKELSREVKILKVKIAILVVPSEVAQNVVNQLTDAGIKAIWNFVPIHLDVNEDIALENVNLASSLAVLSHKLNTNKGE